MNANIREIILEDSNIQAIATPEITDDGKQVYHLYSLDPGNRRIMKGTVENGKINLVSGFCFYCETYLLLCQCSQESHWKFYGYNEYLSRK